MPDKPEDAVDVNVQVQLSTTDKNTTKSTKSDKNTQKTDNKTKKEIDNSGSAVSQSGGQPV